MGISTSEPTMPISMAMRLFRIYRMVEETMGSVHYLCCVWRSTKARSSQFPDSSRPNHACIHTYIPAGAGGGGLEGGGDEGGGGGQGGEEDGGDALSGVGLEADE